MLRLAHRILSQNLGTLPDAYIPSSEAAVTSLWNATRAGLLAKEPIIIADNVASYVNDLYRVERTAPRSYSTYPPCPPPFQRFFIEWNCPDSIRYPGNGETFRDMGMLQIGSYVCAFDTLGEAVKQALCGQRLEGDMARIFANTRWQVDCFNYVCLRDGRAIPTDLTHILLDADGQCLQVGGQNLLQAGSDEQPISGAEAIVMMTLGLMQCKNVDRIDVTENEAPPPKWCRRQRVPELKYHALQIDPNLGAKPRTDDRRTEGDRSGKALHICRGHFAHFRDDGVSRGLFGRRQFGTFWIPAHTRGSLEHGKVISTYKVKTPA